MTAFIVIATVLIVFGALMFFGGITSDEGGVSAAGFALAAIGVLVWLSASSSYRRGQIDAMNGIVKYEKQTNSDGETVWVERKQ